MFHSIRSKRPKLNKFDLSHEKKLSCQMGDLVPIFLEEIVPGDRFRVSSEIMMRLAPMLAPVMHRVDVWTHYFFVPNRIIWNEWEDFITGGSDGLAAPVWPFTQTATNTSRLTSNSLAAHLGLPTVDFLDYSTNFSVLPFRAYQQVYNDYYRDQNLTPEIAFSKASGQVTAIDELNRLMTMRKRCWEKDYFTSALPWAQRGESVTVPFSPAYKSITDVYASDDNPLGPYETVEAGDTGTTPGTLRTASSLENLRIENLDEMAGIDINDLRTSNALQRWLELAARGGSRYIEQIRNFFHITSSDARLQRPEYLGGGKQNVVISEVLQTSQTLETGTPLADMAGHGVSVGQTNRFKKGPFEEHGFVIGIMSVLPRTAYQQGIDRKWSRSDRFDYYFPQFAHLGEQAILDQELYFDGESGEPDVTFGYQARYAEYKFHRSEVSGDFRDSLSYWHMARIFDDRPVLNSAFVESNPTQRIFANTTETDDKLWVQVYNKVQALRPMPYYGTPRL